MTCEGKDYRAKRGKSGLLGDDNRLVSNIDPTKKREKMRMKKIALYLSADGAMVKLLYSSAFRCAPIGHRLAYKF